MHKKDLILEHSKFNQALHEMLTSLATELCEGDGQSI